MRSWISRGQCQRCQAREVIAHQGRYHLCSRCNPQLFKDVSADQKNKYLATGSVHDNNGKKNAN